MQEDVGIEMETVKRVEQTTEKEQTEDRLVVEEEEVEIEVEVWNSMQTANRVGQTTEKEETVRVQNPWD